MASQEYLLRVHGAQQIVLICTQGQRVLTGAEMNSVETLEASGEGLSLVADLSGRIVDIGPDSELAERYKGSTFREEVDATGKCVLPGLVDAHTHPVWVGDRVHEFAMKLAGATYMQVHAAGGGINFTVERVRSATRAELSAALCDRLQRMIRAGTTLVEVKSGYGLDTENEVKMLRSIEDARRAVPIEISSTFCGAHSVPRGSTEEEATRDVIERQLPAVVKLRESGELQVDSIDIFFEKGVFERESSRRILTAGKDAGLALNFHGDELHAMGGAELGAALSARAISHLEEISDNGIQAMSESGTVAVLLPTTAYILRLKHPPARHMIEKGVPVALGSDFNPNAHCLSMPMVMHLACVNMRLSMPEVLVAATLNAAAALGRSDSVGSLEKGKMATMLVIAAPRWEHLIYQFGESSLIRHVIQAGRVVYTNPLPRADAI